MKQEYAKLILSLQLLSKIERVKMCVQILKNVTKIEKCKQESTIMIQLHSQDKTFTLFAYLYIEIPIERVKFLEYKSPVIRWPIFEYPNPCYTVTGQDRDRDIYI